MLDVIRPNRIGHHEGNHFYFLCHHQDEAELVAEVSQASLKLVAQLLCPRMTDEFCREIRRS